MPAVSPETVLVASASFFRSTLDSRFLGSQRTVRFVAPAFSRRHTTSFFEISLATKRLASLHRWTMNHDHSLANQRSSFSSLGLTITNSRSTNSKLVSIREGDHDRACDPMPFADDEHRDDRPTTLKSPPTLRQTLRLKKWPRETAIS